MSLEIKIFLAITINSMKVSEYYIIYVVVLSKHWLKTNNNISPNITNSDTMTVVLWNTPPLKSKI